MMIFMLKVMASIWVITLAACSPQLSAPSDIGIKKNQTTEVKPQRKPGAAVRFEHSKPYKIQQYQPTDLSLILLVDDVEGVLVVDTTTSDGLVLNAGHQHQFQLSAIKRYELPIQVTAAHPGRHYIHLQASINTHGHQTVRILSAIVQVGDDMQLEKNNPNQSTADGVVSMPAQETITP